MSDIVERLRLHGDKFPIKDSAEWIDFASLYLVEAADEIEKLRAALRDVLSYVSPGFPIPVTIYDNARAALKENGE